MASEEPAFVDVEIYECRRDTAPEPAIDRKGVVPNAARVLVNGTELLTDATRPIAVHGTYLRAPDGSDELLAVTVTLIARTVRIGPDERQAP